MLTHVPDVTVVIFSLASLGSNLCHINSRLTGFRLVSILSDDKSDLSHSLGSIRVSIIASRIIPGHPSRMDHPVPRSAVFQPFAFHMIEFFAHLLLFDSS